MNAPTEALPTGIMAVAAQHLDEFRAFLFEALEKFAEIKKAAPAECKAASVIAELLEAKRRANRRAVYLTSQRQYLTRFAARHPDLAKVSDTEIEAWLGQFEHPSSRQTWLTRLSVLFSFAVRRGYLKVNPCTRVERVSVDRKVPAILTPEQAHALLASCRANSKPYCILALYAGIRPAEIERLDWSDVDLETGTVRVDGKTRRRRVVPLEPIAVRLLSQCPNRKGRVTPANITLRRWKRSARKLLGGKWTADILRHTAASYLLGLYQEPGKVSYWLGNSPNILLTRYNCPVTQAAVREFWLN